MNPKSLFIRLTTALFVILVCGIPAFCGEIHDAVKAGDWAKVKAQLKDNPELASSKDDDGRTPLHWAARFGIKDMGQLLLDNKADVNARDKYNNTPLHYAIGENYDVMDLLNCIEANLKTKADPVGVKAGAVLGNDDLIPLLSGSFNAATTCTIHIKDTAELCLRVVPM
jgi:ankyrin repeat protein